MLHSWHRATTGEWYGLVSFAAMFANLNPPADCRRWLAD